MTVALDEIAIERAMHGDPVRLRPTERVEVVRRLTARKLSTNQIADRLGITPRTVSRIRQHHGITAAGART
jgi:DNA-binding CsgD family transcriptional regulator